jgi:hypothetical protein
MISNVHPNGPTDEQLEYAMELGEALEFIFETSSGGLTSKDGRKVLTSSIIALAYGSLNPMDQRMGVKNLINSLEILASIHGDNLDRVRLTDGHVFREEIRNDQEKKRIVYSSPTNGVSKRIGSEMLEQEYLSLDGYCLRP